MSARDLVIGAWRRAVAAHDARVLVARTLASHALPPDLRVIALGKVAVRMACGVGDVQGSLPSAIVVTGTEPADQLDSRVTVLRGEHPVPGAGSFEAGRRVLAFARDAWQAQAPVLVLVSGGASSLCEAAAPGVKASTLQALHRELVAGALPIEDMNARRGSLSVIKRGGLARALGPSLWRTAVLVDVASARAAAVGSGPTAVPGAAGRMMVLGTPGTLLSHAAAGLGAIGPVVCAPPADTRPLGALTSTVVQHMGTQGAWASAGEVAIAVPTSALGRPGGRCQHLALSVLVAAHENTIRGSWAFLAAGSDGRDGSGAAGAVVDSEMARTLDVQGARRALATFDSGRFLARIGALIPEHPPTTNLTDLYVGLRID